MGYVHIHVPQPTDRQITSGNCLDCKRRSRFVCLFTPLVRLADDVPQVRPEMGGRRMVAV
jgi:hypothetical protein